MHGIYNQLDKSIIQQTIAGEVLFQFRKWMRPTWIRWMGNRYNIFTNKDKSTYSEQLAKYQSGAFSDFGRFMRTPYVQAKYQSGQNPELNAMVIMFAAYGDFLKNLPNYYSLLTPSQQANVKRTVAFISTLLGLTGLLVLAGVGYGDDDKDKPKYRDWALYAAAGLQTEYMDILPYYGWLQFYKRTRQNVVPAEKSFQNMYKVVENTIAYPFRTEEERLYQRGQYKGEDKLNMSLKKALPIYRQVVKELYLSSSISYYNMWNPFVQN